MPVTANHAIKAFVSKKSAASLVRRLSALDAAEREQSSRRDTTHALFPYGMFDWNRIVTGQYFYTDKTKAIKDLESCACFCKMWRPRRSGKSLFCQQLASYYDIAVDEDQVIRLNLARINIVGADNTLVVVVFFPFTTLEV
jgi:hypothetical protein